MTAQERDPNGFSQHTPGAKLDAGKLRAGLVVGGFARALKEVVRVGTFGANKYSPNGWRSVSNGQERYLDALFRHLIESEFYENDNDSGISHLAHAAWNILAVLELKMLDAEKHKTIMETFAPLEQVLTLNERVFLGVDYGAPDLDCMREEAELTASEVDARDAAAIPEEPRTNGGW